MKGIHLISGPRNISTALMYAFAHRSDCDVVDEPFYAYYLSKSNRPHPGAADVINAMSVHPDKVLNALHDTLRRSNELFVKNMPHHMLGIDPMLMKEFQPVFLIRHPSLMIASFSKVITDVSLLDLALKEQVAMFEALQPIAHPIVLDAATLLKDPASGMRRLCELLEIPFEESMLHWEPGPIKQDGPWAKYWYAKVHASDGIRSRIEVPCDVDPRYAELLSEALPYYQHLKSFESI